MEPIIAIDGTAYRASFWWGVPGKASKITELLVCGQGDEPNAASGRSERVRSEAK